MRNHIFTEETIINALDRWPNVYAVINNIIDYLVLQINAVNNDIDDVIENIPAISPLELKLAVLEAREILDIFAINLKDLMRFIKANKDNQLLSNATLEKVYCTQREAKLVSEEFDNIIGLYNLFYGDISTEFPPQNFIEKNKHKPS